MARILIGVTGSVALYKSLNVIRLLEKQGYEVKVVLTPSAEKFISGLLFSSVMKGQVYTDTDYWKYGKSLHIELARWAEVIAVVPCTANTLSKIRYSLSDNLLTALILAFKGPILLAPSMHEEMWHNPEVQESVKYLKEARNVFFSGPGKGPLASGESGCGRLYDEEFIVEDIISLLKGRPLRGISVLVSYGRTEEPMDVVRVITNKSSGTMGFYLSRKVLEYGGNLYQVVGETSIPPYGRGHIFRVKTAEEMYEQIKKLLHEVKVLIMAAAVSDYKPEKYVDRKIKKQDRMQIELVKTIDILSELSREKREGQIFVGFALESDNLVEYAKMKMKQKNLDLIVGNYPDAMGSDFSSGVIIDRNGSIEEFNSITKEALSDIIIQKVLDLLK
ncbi:MAG: bifunctional phosphopantothenoylcysteine decarboxylase/phosphopantothenate--cysteine ligase CoaBC [Candidatus Hydrothermia bacterium]